jgi:hypothetical protein
VEELRFSSTKTGHEIFPLMLGGVVSFEDAFPAAERQIVGIEKRGIIPQARHPCHNTLRVLPKQLKNNRLPATSEYR